MTIPANLAAEAAPWGSIPVTVCWGTQGGPYNPVSTANPLPVQGTAATNSAVAGNPLYVGLYNSGTVFPLTSAAYIGDGENGHSLSVAPTLYNGVSWDQQRANTERTLLASAARTATTSSADVTNFNGRGLQVLLNVTAASGTGGLTLTIQGKDPVSGNYYNLNANPTAITATGLTVYEVYPGVGAAGGGVTQRTSASLPRTFRVTVTHGDASSYTYSVGTSLLL